MKTKQKDFKTIPVKQPFKNYRKKEKINWDIYLTPEWALGHASGARRVRARPPLPPFVSRAPACASDARPVRARQTFWPSVDGREAGFFARPAKEFDKDLKK
jgi:hypothetical protein